MRDKEIRMSYSEHEEMLNTIKKQDETIKKLSASSNKILVSDRMVQTAFGFGYHSNYISLPNVIVGDEVSKHLKDIVLNIENATKHFNERYKFWEEKRKQEKHSERLLMKRNEELKEEISKLKNRKTENKKWWKIW
jgi:hypothetical protein